MEVVQAQGAACELQEGRHVAVEVLSVPRPLALRLLNNSCDAGGGWTQGQCDTSVPVNELCM
jgi:hypothetical protein